MSNCAFHMATPLIGLDIEDKMKTSVDVVVNQPLIGRDKDVIAIVRGTGGGKSRCVEEIRRRLLVEEGTVVTAITFNSNSHCTKDTWISTTPHGGTIFNAKQKYALSVVSRLVFSILEGPSSYAELVTTIFGLLPQLNKQFVYDELIHAFIIILIQKFNDVRDVPVKKLVVIMDEVVKMEEELGMDDITSVACSAILDKFIVPGVDIALIISSITMTSLRKTESERGIVRIDLPVRLDVSAIVSSWWGMGDRSPAEKSILRSVASSLNNLPRALSFANLFLRRQGTRPIDKTLVSDLYVNLFSTIKSKYNFYGWPASSIIYPLVFREIVCANAEGVMVALKTSVYTNVLQNFVVNAAFMPDASLIFLRTLAANDDTHSKVALAFRKSIDSVVTRTATTQASEVGIVLEMLYAEWLNIRIATACYHSKVVPSITLEKLLGTGTLVRGLLHKNNKFLLTILETSIEVLYFDLPVRTTLAAYSVDDVDVFLDELVAVDVTEVNPLAIISPLTKASNKQEPFDVILKAFVSGHKKPLYIFIDCKSGPESETIRATTKMSDAIKENPKQYRKVQELAAERDLDILYLYLTTDDVRSFLVGEKSNAIVMGREDSLAFFGPAAELYCALRDSLTESTAAVAEMKKIKDKESETGAAAA